MELKEFKDKKKRIENQISSYVYERKQLLEEIRTWKIMLHDLKEDYKIENKNELVW